LKNSEFKLFLQYKTLALTIWLLPLPHFPEFNPLTNKIQLIEVLIGK
jgi:hypothetical protein